MRLESMPKGRQRGNTIYVQIICGASMEILEERFEIIESEHW